MEDAGDGRRCEDRCYKKLQIGLRVRMKWENEGSVKLAGGSCVRYYVDDQAGIARIPPSTRRSQYPAWFDLDSIRTTCEEGGMNWFYQVLSFFVAFGPVILGTLLWHILWNDDSDSSSNPPGGGSSWRPVPPPPCAPGDRTPVRSRSQREPRVPRTSSLRAS